jgi:hypothetical protein
MVKYSCDYQKQDPLSGRKPGGCLFIFNAKRNFLMQLCIEKFPFYAIFHENIQIQRGLVFFCYIGILFAYIKVLTGALFTYHLLTTEARLHHISSCFLFFILPALCYRFLLLTLLRNLYRSYSHASYIPYPVHNSYINRF